MTPREIAQEIVKRWGEQQRTPGQSPDLAGLIAEALAAEREACAKIAEKYAGNHSTAALMTALMIAQAIRTGRTEGTP
jgi:NADH:ubiquinone oxidoreductase subunit E